MNTIQTTHFDFPGQTSFYRGKVRDVYQIGSELLIMVATDRLSAFDVVLPKGIPYKGQVLNQLASQFLHATKDLVPNWLLGTPDPNVSIGWICKPYPVEMVIRGYLSGHAWRLYKAGKREICGVALPEGLRENDKLPSPIITPTTKAKEGHDEDISTQEILQSGLIPQATYRRLEQYTKVLFARGTQLAKERGLLLVDTKYEFGERKGQVLLIDEIHTPDSSRYFIADGYEERQQAGEKQKQLSKEFVRQWLIENGFQGKPGQEVPPMSMDFINSIADRYIELYEHLSGQTFVKSQEVQIEARIEQRVIQFLGNYKGATAK